MRAKLVRMIAPSLCAIQVRVYDGTPIRVDERDGELFAVVDPADMPRECDREIIYQLNVLRGGFRVQREDFEPIP